jgi:uncharacterized Zn-finger protein
MMDTKKYIEYNGKTVQELEIWCPYCTENIHDEIESEELPIDFYSKDEMTCPKCENVFIVQMIPVYSTGKINGSSGE